MTNKEKMNRVLLNDKDLHALEEIEKEVRKQLEEIALATPSTLRDELKTTYYPLDFLALEGEPGHRNLKVKADLLEILLRELRDDLKLIDNYDLQTKNDGWLLPRGIYEVPPSEEFGVVIRFYPAQWLEKANHKKSGEERKNTTQVQRHNLISRNGNGDFHYKNKLIKFDNKDAIYYLIFECLYEKGDLEGFCSYEIIDKYLVQHGKEEANDERKRIQNGIMDLFRFSNLPPKTSNNKKLIQTMRGKGIVLYNPPL